MAHNTMNSGFDPNTAFQQQQQQQHQQNNNINDNNNNAASTPKEEPPQRISTRSRSGRYSGRVVKTPSKFGSYYESEEIESDEKEVPEDDLLDDSDEDPSWVSLIDSMY